MKTIADDKDCIWGEEKSLTITEYINQINSTKYAQMKKEDVIALLKEISEKGLLIAHLIAPSSLQYLNDKNEWEDTTIHTINELLLFISYGVIYRIKPL
jgi:hypothetical protein